MRLSLYVILSVTVTAFYGWCWQNAYKIIGEYARITYFNKSLAENAFCVPYKYNRSTMAVNASFNLLVDVRSNHDMQLKITGLQFRSNEYRKGPIEFMLPICGMLKAKPYDIASLVEHSNLPHQCPLLKGHYRINGFLPNSTNYPPLIPEGKWMLQLDFFYKNEILVGTLEYMFHIEYPNRFF